jgi:hypothetical protein
MEIGIQRGAFPLSRHSDGNRNPAKRTSRCQAQLLRLDQPRAQRDQRELRLIRRAQFQFDVVEMRTDRR